MSVLPDSRDKMLDWFKERIDLWSTNSASIGLDSQAVIDFKDQLDAAIAQRDETTLKRNAAKAATGKLNDLADAARVTGSAMIQTIKAYAVATGNPNVLDLSQIPKPKTPAPLPAPEAPTGLTATIQPMDGATIVTWDASIAGGVNFTIHRAIDTGSGTGEPVLVGTVGERTFIDHTVPGCTRTATYAIRAWRGDKSSSPSDPFTIRYTSGNGEGQAGQAEAA